MMQRRGWQGAPPPCAGFQRHHLIPIALLRRSQMAAMFDHLQREGFALENFGCNGLMLPACEPMALRLGHALHRGRTMATAMSSRRGSSGSARISYRKRRAISTPHGAPR